MDTFDLLLTKANLSLAGGVFVLLQTLKMVFPTFFQGKLGQRLVPVIPLLFGVAGSMAGMCSGTRWQEKVMIGLIAGFAAGHSFKVGKTTLLGKGIDVDDPAPAPDAPAEPPKKEG